MSAYQGISSDVLDNLEYALDALVGPFTDSVIRRRCSSGNHHGWALHLVPSQFD